MYSSLALAATLAAVGKAFLIPPTISSADNGIVNTIPFEHAVEAETRMLELDCPGCPVLASDLLGHPHALQLDNKLRLNFSVAHEEVDKLCLNGLAIHPMDVLGFHGLTAPQIVRVGSEPSVAASPQLGFHLSIGQPHQSSKTDELHLYELELEIVEVAEKFVDGIPAVNLKFLKTPSGKIMISDLETLPSSKPSLPIPASHDHGKECTSPICKWRAIIADKLSKLKGCGSKVRPGHKRPKPLGHGRPRPEGSHRPHHRHHRKHSAFMRIMRSIILHIVIPITIGIIAGVTASLVGMVVGHLVVFVWRTLFRRGSNHRQYVKLQQEEIEESNVDAKGAPPVYEDAPAYEEAVLDEKSSE